MFKFLIELYFGHVFGWEQHVKRTSNEEAIHDKIQAERQYFSEMVPEEDIKRWDEFEDLYTRAHALEDMRTFIYAFRLGVMLICAVFMGGEELDDCK